MPSSPATSRWWRCCSSLQFVVPEYHQLTLTRCMVFAVYAIGFNVLFGYTGLLSLGHAMFFGAGLYGAGMAAYWFAVPVPLAFLAGCLCGLLLGVAVAFVALRTTGVAFMIVTLMFAQAFHLSTLYFGDWTRGDEGLVLPEAARSFGLGSLRVNLVDPSVRYDVAVILLLVAVIAALALARGPRGRVLVAIRENEERTRMLGFDTLRAKREALVVSRRAVGRRGRCLCPALRLCRLHLRVDPVFDLPAAGRWWAAGGPRWYR